MTGPGGEPDDHAAGTLDRRERDRREAGPEGTGPEGSGTGGKRDRREAGPEGSGTGYASHAPSRITTLPRSSASPRQARTVLGVTHR
ncbi:hypothetical protein GCM10019017_34820 [Streptomyces showdoensis]